MPSVHSDSDYTSPTELSEIEFHRAKWRLPYDESQVPCACLGAFTRVVSICLRPSGELKLKRHIQPATPMIRPFA